jgi:hypothetical protein
MNLIGINNELGDTRAMANDDNDSGDFDSGNSDSFGDFFWIFLVGITVRRQCNSESAQDDSR